MKYNTQWGQWVVATQDNSPYPEDFKIEAVQLLRESGKSLSEISNDLGVSTNYLREWSKRFESKPASDPA